jgi:nitrogen regulatory protein PII
MKMIWAMIRPEFARQVIVALEHAGIWAMTRLNVTGSGLDRENPPLALPTSDKPWEMLMIAVPDNEVAKAVMVIRAHARSEEPGPHDGETSGNGKIFVTYIDESLTIRTAGIQNRGPCA